MFRRALLAAALLMGAVSAPAFAQCDTAFTITNRSNTVVNELYFSRSSNQNWGNDRLGANVLAPGASANFRPSPGGSYDFKVVFANGQSQERRNIDLCSVSNVIVRGNGISAE
jgi:hypothetical protein